MEGAVTQVRLEVIGRVCLHRNGMGCQIHVRFCFDRTIQTYFIVHSAYKQHISITMIKSACANLEQNV